MKEIEELPIFTAQKHRRYLLVLVGALLVSLLGSGCSIKQTVKVNVPQGIREAKTADFKDLLNLLRGYDRITSLTCNELRLTFTSSRKVDIGELEKYPTLKGYILLQRPNSTHLVLLMPVTQSKFLDVLSVGDSLSVWYPRENNFYEGRNSARDLVVEDPSGAKDFAVPIRGSHIFEAIFPQSIAFDDPGVWISLDEQRDGQSSYYILTFTKEGIRPRAHTIRKIWIERLGLTIARQQVFGDEGQIVSDIAYANQMKMEGFSIPQQIHIERPVDGYTLDLSFKNWRINPELSEDAFKLQPPSGAKIVALKEKGRSAVR